MIPSGRYGNPEISGSVFVVLPLLLLSLPGCHLLLLLVVEEAVKTERFIQKVVDEG